MKLHKMIEMYLKYDNMHKNGTVNAFICINIHVNSYIKCILSKTHYISDILKCNGQIDELSTSQK